MPTAITLPYTYKSIPSSLPPSVTIDPNGSDKPRYVVSSSGHAAHPDEIIASCDALANHMKNRQAEDEAAIKQWQESIKQRELAEKRRVAPGWLDREEKILQPLNPSGQGSDSSSPSLLDRQSAEQTNKSTGPAIIPRSEAEDLDRAFGHLDVK